MSRSTTLAIVHPVDKLQGSDDAVRTQVWAETTHLLIPMLGKLYARFEPAQKAWRQATYTPLGVVLGRTDPALFLYFFSYVPYKIGKLQIQGFSESTTPTKTKQSYHITQKAAQSRPRAAFLRGRLGRRQDFSKK